MKRLAFCAMLAAAATLPGQRSSQTDEAEIRALESRWDAAQLKGDVTALNEIFADGFISTNGEGKTRGKADVINEVKAGNIKFESSQVQDMKVTVYGDAAVVTGTWKGKFTQKGKPMDLTERFTDTFVKQNGKWRVAASHGSTLKQ